MNLRKILPALAILLGSLALSVPAAATSMHQLAHAQTPVAASQHHHHAASGEVEFHGHEDEQSGDERSDQGVGHSHSSGSFSDLATTATAPAIAAIKMAASVQDRCLAKLPTVDPPPKERPPQTA